MPKENSNLRRKQLGKTVRNQADFGNDVDTRRGFISLRLYTDAIYLFPAVKFVILCLEATRNATRLLFLITLPRGV
jgi:hypothetical protein